MMFAMPLISVYFSYVMPGAIGFYWIISTLTSFLSQIVVYRCYSPAQISARSEARRAALRFQEEAAVAELPPAVQRSLAEKISAPQQHSPEKKGSAPQKKGGKAKGKKAGKSGNDNYLGTKK